MLQSLKHMGKTDRFIYRISVLLLIILLIWVLSMFSSTVTLKLYLQVCLQWSVEQKMELTLLSRTIRRKTWPACWKIIFLVLILGQTNVSWGLLLSKKILLSFFGKLEINCEELDLVWHQVPVIRISQWIVRLWPCRLLHSSGWLGIYWCNGNTGSICFHVRDLVNAIHNQHAQFYYFCCIFRGLRHF